jgi:hypothetical protein
MKTYSGKYKVKNIDKYAGDHKQVIFRSMWERHVCRWCDDNPHVLRWCSEEVVIPYICETDKRLHRYFVDFLIQFDDGKTVLVEVKPKAQTLLPKKQGKNKKRYINEALTYVKNRSKWKAATEHALDQNMVFQIWTEDTLTSMGIMPKNNPLPKMPKMKAAKRKK